MSVASSMQFSSSGLQRAVNGNYLEQWTDEKISSHWRRNKKASIDLLELPVAVDRQLEDQRLLMERNRNPQLNIPTKVDKVRSEQIIAKIGASRDVAVKAKVLNKIVREASGINTYVITAPPRTGFDDAPVDEDPDTNPHFKAYAKETKKNPVVMSFGHRPRSASRTFNPATMRFRMRHGEMIKAGAGGKYGFGLPVGILAKILKAPKIGGDPFDNPKTPAPEHMEGGALHDPLDLFSLPDCDSPATAKTAKTSTGRDDEFNDSVSELQQGSMGMESWISPTQHSIDIGKKRRSRNGGLTKTKIPKQATGDRDSELHDEPWDTAHHNVRISPKEMYKIKANVMPNQHYTIVERMTRFHGKTIADEITPFCREKQELDMKLLRAGPAAPPATKDISPPKGQQKFHDPNNLNLNYVKKRREESVRKQMEKQKAKSFQDNLASVPKVMYHPNTLNIALQQGTVKFEDIGSQVASVPPLEWEDFRPPSELQVYLHKKSMAYADKLQGMKRDKMGNKLPKVKLDRSQVSLLPSLVSSSLSQVGSLGVTSESETLLLQAMRKAKKGDKDALYELYFQSDEKVGADSSQEGGVERPVAQWVKETEEWNDQSNAPAAGLPRESLAEMMQLDEILADVELSPEDLLKRAVSAKAAVRQATAEREALLEEQRLSEIARLEAIKAEAEVAEAAAAAALRIQQQQEQKEAEARADALRSKTVTPSIPEPPVLYTLGFNNLRVWDLFNTGSAFDAQDPAVRLSLEPGGKSIGKTARQKDAGVAASFPETFTVDITEDSFLAGNLSVRVDVVSVDATGLISKHVGTGKIILAELFGTDRPAYLGEKTPVAVKSTVNLFNTNKKIDKGHLEMVSSIQVPQPSLEELKVDEEVATSFVSQMLLTAEAEVESQLAHEASAVIESSA